ncbi:MAG: hypothetical protein M3478_04790 [Planctomycetota bacterium]|nr:hypothetical protein [Planctomycetota bacterium]
MRLRGVFIVALLTGAATARAQDVERAATSSTAPATRAGPVDPDLGGAVVTVRKSDRTPTRVTLHVADAAVMDVFNAVGKQAGVQFAAARFGMRPRGGAFPAEGGTAFDADDQPFWVALQSLCERTRLRPVIESGAKTRPGVIVLSDVGSEFGSDRPTHASGPALFVARSFTRTSRLTLAEPVREENLTRLELTAYVEPKLRLAQQIPAVRVDEAVDENGTSLAQDADREPQRSSSREGTAWQFRVSVPLRQSPQTGKRLARLRGTARFVGPEVVQLIEIPAIRESTGSRVMIGGQPVDIGALAVDARGYLLHLRMTRTDADDARWGALQQEFDQRLKEVQLLDEQGRALPFGGVGPGGSGKAYSEMTIRFLKPSAAKDAAAAPAGSPAGDPVKLVWEVPLELSDVVIPFEFKDLPLP